MIETLHENEWVSLRVMREPDAGITGYVYSHETRCRGRIVALLPYKDTPSGRRYLLKCEITPCWGFAPVRSAITGGWEGGDIADDAVREMAEETGYSITAADLIPLGECHASKSSDTVYTLYSVDLTGRTPGEATGDGSRLEAESTAVWVSADALTGVYDPQVSALYLRLNAALNSASESAEDVLRWLVSLDDPAGPGREARRAVTLNRIIGRARAVVGDPA